MPPTVRQEVNMKILIICAEVLFMTANLMAVNLSQAAPPTNKLDVTIQPAAPPAAQPVRKIDLKPQTVQVPKPQTEVGYKETAGPQIKTVPAPMTQLPAPPLPKLPNAAPNPQLGQDGPVSPSIPDRGQVNVPLPANSFNVDPRLREMNQAAQAARVFEEMQGLRDLEAARLGRDTQQNALPGEGTALGNATLGIDELELPVLRGMQRSDCITNPMDCVRPSERSPGHLPRQPAAGGDVPDNRGVASDGEDTVNQTFVDKRGEQNRP